MKILFASSEVAPFIKTGGLADVAGSLPVELAKAGHEVKVILPLYERVGQEWREQMQFRCYFDITLAWRRSYCGMFSLEKDGVTYWFVDNEYYFKRYDLYGHFDDAERFAFFSRAVIEAPGHMEFSPDIIHCNDWQTALVPVYLLEERYRQPALANAKTVFTIHNIEYQGRYGKNLVEDIFGLDKSYINEKMLAYYDDISLMKGAIYASDYVTTVSPTYASELHYDFYAHGLAGVVQDCGGKIRGILNGLDMDLYDAAKGEGLAAPFTAEDLSGKAKCKQNLQKLVGLNLDPDVPIVACVSRLVSHKGFDMVAAALNQIMSCNLQMVVLGTGDWNYEAAFRQAQNQYPGRFAACIQYSAALSTAIYAGADLFLMPSVAEPCGLSQMMALRYGTIPIVRETGGLKDTVPPYDVNSDSGLGFTFAQTTPEDMLGAIYRAMGLYFDHRDAFDAMRRRGMAADFSWKAPAREYMDIYEMLVPQPQAAEADPAGEPAPTEEAAPEEEAVPFVEPVASGSEPEKAEEKPEKPVKKRAACKKAEPKAEEKAGAKAEKKSAAKSAEKADAGAEPAEKPKRAYKRKKKED